MPRVVGPCVVSLILVSSALAQGIDPELLAGMKARAIGPAGMSGRVADVQCAPQDPDIVWVGAATGGVWRSTNGGTTFEPMFDDQPVHAIGAIAIAANNTDDVWVGTGEGNVRNSASIGNGVYRTRDGGRTWSHLGLVASERIPRIVLDPRDPETALVAALGPEWGESKERGVFRTRDGGRSWQQILAIDARTGCADLAVDPSNPDHLFAAMWQFRRWPHFFRSGGPSSGLFESFDGGDTWRRLEEEDGMPKGELGRIAVAFCRSQPDVVYALVEAEQSALLRSSDGGKSFVSVNTEPNVNPRPFYFCDLRVDPVWPNRVYALDFFIRVSDDGGRSFRPLRGATSIHPDFHAMWIDPSDPDHLWVGNDGGIAESRDRGETMRFVPNLPLAQFYHVAVDLAEPYNVMGGLQDNLSWRGPNTSWGNRGVRDFEWINLGGGDGFDVQPDPTDPDCGYSMSQGGYLMRWNVRTKETRNLKPLDPEGVALRFNWNAGIAVDPFDPKTVYYGSQFLLRSTDRGESFSVSSPDLTTNDPNFLHQRESGGLTPDVTAAENHCSIIAIAPSPVAKGVIWIGSDDGRLHLTRDGGATWTSLEENVGGVPAGAWIPHIEASKFDPASAFVVFDDHRRSNFECYVFATNDYGKTWRSLGTAAIRGYCHVIEQDPVKPELLWLGTEFGLWFSIDSGTTWMRFRHGLPTASVMDLVTHPREHDLVIATHGRALYVLDDIRPLREMSPTTLAAPLTLHTIAPAQQYWNAVQEDGGFDFGDTEFRGTNRAYGALITVSLTDAALPFADVERENERKAEERAAAAEAARNQPYEARSTAREKDATGATPKKDESRRAEISILGANGERIRTFDSAVHRGVNRIVWDLRRDDFDKPGGGGNDAPAVAGHGDSPYADPGAEVPPGTYGVVVRFGDHEARGNLLVKADPRTPLEAADHTRRADAILAAGKLRDRVAKTARAMQELRSDVERVLADVRAAKAKRDAADRRAGVPVPEIPPKDSLTETAEALITKLTTIERKLLVTAKAGAKGIVFDDDTVWSLVRSTEGALTSSPLPPAPTHLAMLARATTSLETLDSEWRQFVASDATAFRELTRTSGFGETVRIPSNP